MRHSLFFLFAFAVFLPTLASAETQVFPPENFETECAGSAHALTWDGINNVKCKSAADLLALELKNCQPGETLTLNATKDGVDCKKAGGETKHSFMASYAVAPLGCAGVIGYNSAHNSIYACNTRIMNDGYDEHKTLSLLAGEVYMSRCLAASSYPGSQGGSVFGIMNSYCTCPTGTSPVLALSAWGSPDWSEGSGNVYYTRTYNCQ